MEEGEQELGQLYLISYSYSYSMTRVEILFCIKFISKYMRRAVESIDTLSTLLLLFGGWAGHVAWCVTSWAKHFSDQKIAVVRFQVTD